jgi:uncharacterized membrane protein
MLFYSSLLFSTNAISTFYKKYYIYSFFFAALTMTSLLVHTHNNNYNNNQYITYDKALIIDKAAIAAVIAIGGYTFYKKCNNISRFSFIFVKIIIIATFLFVIYLYCYGWCVQDYCFYKEKNIANEYHMLLNLVSSLGHHLITLL